jgi:uncharacterized protein (TIGR02594 family)
MQFSITVASVNLRDAPDPSADHSAGTVVINDVIEKLADADVLGWWRVRVVTSGAPRREGFIRSDLLRELPAPALDPAIDKPSFFNQIAFAAQSFDANRDYLYAVASIESGIRNVPAKTDSSAVGPFQFMPATWADLVARHGPMTGIGQEAIGNPGSQAVFAAIAASEELKALTAALNRIPLGTELYCTHLLGTPAATALLRADRNGPVDAPLKVFYRPTRGDAFVEEILTNNAMLLTSDKAGVVPRTVTALLAEIERRMMPAFLEAADLARQLGLVIDKMPGEPGEPPPWLATAQAQLALGIRQGTPAGPSNPEVEKFFAATDLGHAKDSTAWCAAFVSWCMANCGNAKVAAGSRHSARAADWLTWGFSVGKPTTGAVAVHHPLVAGSSGHVGFVTGEDAGHVRLLAGNQHDDAGIDAVCEVEFAKSTVANYRWMDWK